MLVSDVTYPFGPEAPCTHPALDLPPRKTDVLGGTDVTPETLVCWRHLRKG